ncbi:hypothetical protein AKO1_014242 [Acrasis kona]|uniref:Uncharacterized protein n=1 Tax=Acrasis kona TaxID=1008807 RepID=A0AAW2Z1Z7_9EUKA
MSTFITSINELKVDESLQNLVEKVSKFQKCSLPRCNNPPEVDCVPCQRSLCFSCFEKLHSLIEEHEQSPYGTIKKLAVNSCPKHQKPYEYYCKDCEMQLCGLCTLVGSVHRDHVMATISEYSYMCMATTEEIIKKSESRQDGLRSKKSAIDAVADKVRNVKQDSYSTITTSFDKLMEAVQERKGYLLNQVDLICDAKLHGLLQESSCIGSLISQITRHAKNMKYHLDMHSPSDMIYSRSKIQKLSKECDFLFMEPCYDESLNIFSDTFKLSEVISKFGTVNLKPSKINPPIVTRVDKKLEFVLTWQPYIYSENVEYKVKMLPEDDDSEESSVLVYKGKATTCNIRDVQYGRIYQFTVQALNQLGEGGESDPSAPIVIEPLKSFEYSRDFDENGLIYWLGTDYGTSKRFRNPATTGKIEVTCSSMNSGTPELATGRIDTEFNTTNTSKSWLTFNLKTISIIPNRYSIKHGGTTAKPDYLRNWDFLGSKDGVKWTLLRRHQEDSMFSWEIKNVDEDYSYFRILQTGRTSRGTDYLETRGFFEIYGKLVRE